MFGLGDQNTEEKAETEKTESQDLKKKRDQYAVEIRKQKRDELLSKRRNRNLEIDEKIQTGAINTNLAKDQELKDCIDQWLKKPFEMSEFLSLVESANSNDRFKQHYGVIGLRKILSNENGPPIQPIIDANMVPRLIQFMLNDDELHLQLEAAWALTNVASGTTAQTQSIIDKGGIPCFIRLLQSKRAEVAEQAIWALGNIAGDSAVFRDLILKYQGLQPLLAIIQTATDKTIIKHGVWAVSNLCRGKPLPTLELVEAAIPVLSVVLQKDNEPEVLTDAAWAISYLARNEPKIKEIVETGIIPSLVQHLSHSHLPLVIPCLRTIGNIVTGNEVQTDLVLQMPGFLERIFLLANHKKKAVRREACWTISNITAGTSAQIDMIMGTQEHVNLLMEIAMKDIPEVQREAAWVLSNATKNSNPMQIARIIEAGVMDCFIQLLNCQDSKTVEVVLEGIHNMLNWGAYAAAQSNSPENEFLVLFEQKEGVGKIEELQTHPNNEIYMRALKILEAHFELESVL